MRKVLLLAASYILLGSITAQTQYSVMGSDGVIRNPEEIKVELVRVTKPWREIAENASDVEIYHEDEWEEYGERYEREEEEEAEGMLQGRKVHNRVNPNALPIGEDPLRQKHYNTQQYRSTQTASWEGMSTTTMPGDPVMDVGPNHVVQMLNSGSNGTNVKIWNKTGTVLMNATAFHTLAGTTQGLGDPIVLYDQRADRWFLTEFSTQSTNKLYIAISQTNDPTGSYYIYSVTTNSFPDYPKYAIWDDSYIVTTNESPNAAVYALDRTSMLAGNGNPNAQRFTFPQFGTIGFQPATPVGQVGTGTAGGPCLIMRVEDDGWSNVTQDALQMWSLTVDWTNPTASTMSQTQTIPVAAYDSDLCGYSSFSCITQPSGQNALDPLREILMNRIMYRNFGNHESIVCAHVTDVTGNDLAGIRWYELRRTGGPTANWSIYQSGTYSPDSDNRWMPTIGISASGNIGLGFNVSSSSVFPSIRYTGRQECDPLGQMTQPETTLAAGTASNNSNRWGDYNAMGIDPTDGETFWFNAQYNPSSQASTRIGAFNINVCNSTTPPTCGINASATSITAGSSVNFTDGSSGGPTSWSWNFDNGGLGGSSQTTSTTQNPGSVTFSNVGTYDVQLIASNANGTCTTNVSINVAASVGCDTLLNIQATDTLRIYSANGGYLAGWNGFGDLSKAEAYSNFSPYTYVNGFAIYLFGVNDGGNGATVDFNVWGDNAGQPGTILGTVTYPLSTLDNALASNGGQGVLDILFSPAINVGAGPMYCGITMNGFGTNDSLGIVTNSIYDPTPNSGWEVWSTANGGGWHDMQTSWNYPISMYISPYVTDQPVSGTLSASATSTCAGNTINYTANGTNATGYNWVFNGGTPSTSTNATETVTYAAAGTYMSYLVLDGACSGQAIDSVQVTITAGPTPTATPTDPTCAGNDGQIVVSATGATQFSVDGGTTFQATGTFTGLSAGTYNVVVVDANGCQGTTTTTLNPGGGTLTVTSTPTNPSCGASDGQIVVSATGATQFSVDGGTTFQATGTFTGLAAGTYNIVVQDANGCQGTDVVTLANPSAPTISAATPADVSCNGMSDGTITVSASGGSGSYTYSIDNGSTFQASGSFTGLAAGAYNVVVQDGTGCSSAPSAITINEPTAITVTPTVTDASCGLSNGSISVSATGGSGTLQYSIDGGSTYQASSTFSSLAAGTYQVMVQDANGCTSVASSQTVGSSGAVSASATNTGETCNSSNGSITVSATGGSGTFQYSIDGGANFQSSGTFSGLAAGTYNIVVQDAGGCQGTTTSTITNTGGVIPTISPDQTICSGNSATINAGGAGTGGTYAWDNGLGSGSSHVVTPTVTTTYNVVITDASGCQANASTTVTVEQQPTVTVTPGNTTICSGASVTLTASGAQSYVWNTGASTSSITVSPVSQTTFTVIGQNGSCSGSPVSTTISVDPSPTVVANASLTSIQVGGTVQFNTNGSVASSYSWNFGDGNTSTQSAVTHTYNVMGTYTVVLTGTLGNCTATDTVVIYVGTTGVDEIDLENAISTFPNPNSGSFKLKIALSENQDVNVTLYNTIGQVIETRSLQNVSNTTVDFDLSDKSGGFYLINVKTQNGDITKRISVIK